MSSDTALLASVRTSMAMITFGFIIFEYLERLSGNLVGELPGLSPKRFATALIALGIILLCIEIVSHARYAQRRRRRRQALDIVARLNPGIPWRART